MFSLWWLPGNAALWPLEGEIDSTSWHCLSFVPSSKHGKKKKEGSQQRQASFLLPFLQNPLSFLSFLSFLFLLSSHIPSHWHIQLKHIKSNSLVCCHIQALNRKWRPFWRDYNRTQCLNICPTQGKKKKKTCCHRKYSSILLQCSHTITHIQHDSA